MPAFIDMTGKRFGRLLVIERVKSGNKKKTMWKCVCDCGNIKIADGVFIRCGDTSSCGCLQRERTSQARVINEVGNRYGNLVVVKRAEKSPFQKAYWVCVCDCGNQVVANGDNLRRGKTRDCGWKCTLVHDSKNLIDETGKIYGKLTVIKRDRIKLYGKDRKRIQAWICECECGSVVSVLGASLRSGATKSCGCMITATEQSVCHTLYLRTKRGADIRGYSWNITEDFFNEVISKNCAYCGKPPKKIGGEYKKDFFYNGLDRVNNSIGYEPENVVPCCIKCNRAKSVYSIDDFREWVVTIYNHWASKP